MPSRTNPHEHYLVDLTAYNGQGQCQCKHFECRLAPLLSRLVKPETAVAEGLVHLKPGQREEDALRCEHIMEARRTFTSDVLARIVERQKQEAAGRPEGI